jgi:hypothetical protein
MNARLDVAKRSTWNRILYRWPALVIFCGFGGRYAPAQQEVPKMPMQPIYEDGAEARWLKRCWTRASSTPWKMHRHGPSPATER